MSDFAPQGSFKELEDVIIKTLSPVVVNGIEIEEGETIAAFDRVSVSGMNEILETISARGGYQNVERVTWETTKEVQFSFEQGVFSMAQFSLMNNARVLNINKDYWVCVNTRDKVETDGEGKLMLNFEPYVDSANKFFLYELESGRKLSSSEYSRKGKEIETGKTYTEYLAEYKREKELESYALIGEKAFDGYVSVEGHTVMKDDATGRLRSVIIYMPKVKIKGSLNMRLGTGVAPVVGKFIAAAQPVGLQGKTHTVDFFFLKGELEDRRN